MQFSNIFVLVSFLGSVAFFLWNVRKLVRFLRIGKKQNRSSQVGDRIKRLLVVGFGQSKMLREPLAGIMHFVIFWGFILVTIGTVEMIAGGVRPGFSFSFLGPLYGPLLFLEDLAAVLVIAAVLVAIWRRVVTKPKRLMSVESHPRHARLDALFILVLILILMVTLLFMNAPLDPERDTAHHDWMVFSKMTGSAFLGLGLDEANLEGVGTASWWAHYLVVLLFLNYLPYSKHLHILTSLPNVYFASNGPKGLEPMDFEDESAESFGARDVEDLTWKQLLDSFTCTECGRCTASCPANLTGKLLSPRKIIVDTRLRLTEKAPLLLDGKSDETRTDAEKKILEKNLVDDFITEEELWSCTTCGACEQECPVEIEHISSIVELRRGLVLNEGRLPEEAQLALRNLESQGSPWGFGAEQRTEWANGLDLKLLKEDEKAEWLLWVGCAGAFDDRAKKITRSFAGILEEAGVDYGILGPTETCTGDPARRMGNEYLAEELIKQNIETLKKHSVGKICTACPHCFNTLKNEYSKFGADFDVVHHTQMIADLVANGKIRPKGGKPIKMTYHDSCYLGRYNDEYQAPRDTLRSIPGVRLEEMPRSRSNGLCCGAGGGRMWMEETVGKRVNIERTEEALSRGPDVIATACPFCMTMLTDGVKSKGAASDVEVRDVAEIVYGSLKDPGEPRS